MRLTVEKIKEIDVFLQAQGIKYIDVRYEMIDHLASEFENDSDYVLLEDFLNSKRHFVRNLLKRKQKSVHWAFQRKLWIRLFSFFKKPLSLIGSGILFLFVFWLRMHLDERGYKIAFTVMIIIPLLLSLLIYFKSYSKHKNLIQGECVFNIMALPQCFLYMVPLFKDALIAYPVVLSLFWWFTLIIAMAGFTEFMITQKKILKQYNSLKLL